MPLTCAVRRASLLGGALSHVDVLRELGRCIQDGDGYRVQRDPTEGVTSCRGGGGCAMNAAIVGEVLLRFSWGISSGSAWERVRAVEFVGIRPLHRGFSFR